jgi:hypothetical protein
MTIGISIFLLAVGAVLAFAVSVAADGINLNTVGYILMAAGGLGLLWSLVVASGVTAPTRERVVREERPL